MNEYGFWTYTDPLAGGCAGYREPQWDALLDDMAAGGMNSLAICLRGKRTGYKSRLPYLDQPPNCPVIESDNRLVHHVIEQAHQRGIKVWLQNSINIAQVKEYGMPADDCGPVPKHGCFKFDLDIPVVVERALDMCREYVGLFPKMDGLSVETEAGYGFRRHRIAPYNAWAKANGKPSYEELAARDWDSRIYPYETWREYATHRTCEVLKQVEQLVRGLGFRGQLSHIAETNTQPGTFQHAYDLNVYQRQMTGWITITYDYFRWIHPLATTEFCMAYPKSLGLTTYYLGRGVMVWGKEMPVSFEEHWRRDFEDALATGVDGLWFFEADAFTDGDHCNRAGLQRKGFPDGVAARRTLLQIGQECGVSVER